MSDTSIVDLVRNTKQRFWIEKTPLQGFADRMSGEWALGQALWQTKKETVADDPICTVMPGDNILHLADDAAIIGVSKVADEPYRAGHLGPSNTRYSDEPVVFVQLKNYVALERPIHTDDLFKNQEISQQLEEVIKEFPLGTNLFCDRDLKLCEDYLTPAPPELVAILDRVYKSKTNHDLPYLLSSPASEYVKKQEPTRPIYKQLLYYLIPFLAVIFASLYYAQQSGAVFPDSLAPGLLAVSVAIAVFAVNFPIFIRQLAKYGAHIGVITGAQATLSIAAFVLALLPLIVLTSSSRSFLLVSVITIPLVAYSSLALGVIALHETDPIAILNKNASKEAIGTFLLTFAEDAQAQSEQFLEMQLSKIRESPPEEFGRTYIEPTTTSKDPFSFLAGFGVAAIQNSDVNTYDNVVRRALEAYILAKSQRHEDGSVPGYRVDSALSHHAYQTMRRLSLASYELDKSGAFTARFLNICSSFVRKQAVECEQARGLTQSIVGIMKLATKKMLASENRDLALILVDAARQATQKGLDSSAEQKKDDFMFDLILAYLPRTIKEVGEAAALTRDVRCVLHCMEALGWLGCSAVRKCNREVGIACVLGIVQLGRLGRAKDLECFHTNCGGAVSFHAYQWIKDIATWILVLDTEEQATWLDLISEAYSRLLGRRCEFSISKDGDKSLIQYSCSEKPYLVKLADNDGERVFDYSNTSFTRDLVYL
jgi:hypothetical protein